MSERAGLERPLRVGFLLFDYPVVSEAFIANHARALADLGVDLTLAALARQADDEMETTEQGAVFRIISGGMPVRIADRWRSSLKRVRSQHPSPLAALSLVNPLRHGHHALDLKALYAGPLLLRAGALDILHCQFASLGDAAMAARLAGFFSARTVIHFRGHDITSYVRRNGTAVYRRLFGRADYFLANCEYFRQKALALGCRPERLGLLRSGIDLSRFPLRSPRGLSERPLRLVSVGRLVEKKGFHLCLEALANLRSNGLDVRYSLIGDGPLRGMLEERARQLGVREQVDFLGSVPNATLAPLVAKGDIFLAPSSTPPSGDQDGVANTVKEAMALGLPVVVTRHSGLPELVIDGVTGLTVPEHSPAAIVAAIVRLLADSGLVESVVREGRRKVEEEYDATKLSHELIGIYRRVLELPAPSEGDTATGVEGRQAASGGVIAPAG